MAHSGKIAGSKKALREQSKKRKRTSGRMPIRRRYLIACEGQETEPNYFIELSNQLPRDIVVMAKGEGRNTLSLVQWAEHEAQKLEQDLQPADEVWIVMDRDSFPSYDFDNAIHSAEAKGYNVAWSNECFELWVLLHFREITASTPRGCLYQELSKAFKIRNYEKEGKGLSLYSLIRKNGGNEEQAIARADALWQQALQIKEEQGVPFSQANPATGIFRLVQQLNKYKKA